MSKIQDLSTTITDWMARGSFFITCSVIIHLIFDLNSAYQTFSGIVFCKTLLSIHSYSPISIFMNHLFRWIFKVYDKSFCIWHWSKVSWVLQNRLNMTIFWKDLAKTSSEHYKLKFWKKYLLVLVIPWQNVWSTSEVDYCTCDLSTFTLK